MQAAKLETNRLILDQPVESDIEAVYQHCQDPVFERFLTTPWPYLISHAEGFVREYVPSGWSSNVEATFAIRTKTSAELLGVIGIRKHPNYSDVGFWLAESARGNGYLPEALKTVIPWAFDSGFLSPEDDLIWYCYENNFASASVARKCGFEYLETAPSLAPGRDGDYPISWIGKYVGDSAKIESWPNFTYSD